VRIGAETDPVQLQLDVRRVTGGPEPVLVVRLMDQAPAFPLAC
jgi:hypothetical protein